MEQHSRHSMIRFTETRCWWKNISLNSALIIYFLGNVSTSNSNFLVCNVLIVYMFSFQQTFVSFFHLMGVVHIFVCVFQYLKLL